MKPLLVRCWHGNPPPESHFQQKLDRVAPADETGNRMFDGNLGEFARVWADKFMFFPPKPEEQKYIDGNVFVTQHSSFGQR